MKDNLNEWTPIPLMPGFEADLYSGRICDVNNGRVLKPFICKSSCRYYWRVRVDGAVHRVHRLVLAAALGRPLEACELVRHLDGDASNNAASNLAVGSAADNSRDKLVHNTNGRKLRNSQVREIRLLAGMRHSPRSLAKQFGVSAGHVKAIVNRTAWAGLS